MSAPRTLVGGLLLVASVACSAPPLAPPGTSDVVVPFDPTKLAEQPVATDAIAGPLRFSLTAYLSGGQQKALLDGMSGYLSTALGTEVRGVTPQSYDEALFSLMNEAVDFALVSPTLYVKVQSDAPTLYEPIAATVAAGSMVYESYVVVKRDSPIMKVGELMNKRVAFPHRLSTSGYVYPRAYLLTRGIDVERDVTLVETGRHDSAVQALLDDKVDAAFIASDTLVVMRVLAMSGPVRVLAKAGRMPFDAVVVKASLPATTKARIRHSMLTLSLHTAEGRRALVDESRINGFIPVPPGHYDEVHAAWKRSE